MIFVLSFVILSLKLNLIFTKNQTEQLLSLDNQWQTFKIKYQKSYFAGREETRRRLIWETNLRIINRHNRDAINGRHAFFLGMNKYGDMTPREFRRKMNGLKPNKIFDLDSFSKKILSGGSKRMIKEGPRVDAVDWRTKGYVTPIKDQGYCGSCWAFSAVAALEGQVFKKHGKSIDLSEQNLVDCSKNDENSGCNGGFMEGAYKYIMNNGGLDKTEAYAYEGKDGVCRFKPEGVGANVTNYVRLISGDESGLTDAIANIGPIAVAIDASRLPFQFYSSGIYYEPHCSSEYLNHAVTAVGYGTKGDGLDYYIVKNSWGETWGENGYVLMARNKNNNCGIATESLYPII